MRNLILSLVIVTVSILNLSAQDTLITNVRNMVVGAEDLTERIDYTIVIDSNFTKVRFISKKKNTSFEVKLVSLEESVSDGSFKLLTFNTEYTDKLTILYDRNEISIVSIEKNEDIYTNFLFSDIVKNFPKAKN
jgi:hypothetical protein